MSSRKRQQGKGFKYFLAAALGALVIGAAVWLVFSGFEGGEPRIELNMENEYISEDHRIEGEAWDEKSGVRRIRLTLVQDESEDVLIDEQYEKGDSAGKHDPQGFSIDMDTRELGISDGKALLRVEAWDYSWRNGFSGNRAISEKDLVVDTTSPHVEVLTGQHNVSQGGAGLIAYRLSEDCPRHGVSVDGHFFPGYSGYFDDPEICIAFFGLAHDQDTDVDMYVEAEDRAGNTGRSGFPVHLRQRRFKSATLNITDGFLKKILPKFHDAEGFPDDESPVDQFLYINRELRKKNNETILSSGEQSDSVMHWEGSFLQMPNSQRMASFADRRSYVNQGSEIDKQVHMGTDLASVRHAPVPAANGGRVAFVGRAGIYGNVVTIDHGFGLFSLYAHLSRADVSQGDKVDKGDILGTTGTTGLAGGDHLHYGMFINDIFVEPVEWWDGSWIKNNVTQKLDNVKEMSEGR